MQELAPTTSTTPATAAPTPVSASTGDETTETAGVSVPASDFETFLKLLTAQLRNQDPLKPLDSTEFVAQLASFSAVEQQINTNTKLDSLLSALSNTGIDEASRLIGRNVKATASQIEIEKPGPIDFDYQLPEGATEATLNIRSASGKLIRSLPLSLADQTIAWDGKSTNDSLVSSGRYDIQIEAKKSLDLLEGGQIDISGLVEEAHIGNGDVMLVLKNGLVIAPGDVQTIRVAEAARTDPEES